MKRLNQSTPKAAPRCLSVFAACLCGLWFSPAGAHEYYVQEFTLIHPYAVATAIDADAAPVYFKVEGVTIGDRLLSAYTPHAGRVEFRRGSNALESEAPQSIAIEPGGSDVFGPDDLHLLLRYLKAPLRLGRSYGLTLVFEKAGPVNVMVSVGAH